MDQAAKTRAKPNGRVHPRYNLDLVARLMTEKNEFICFAKVQDMSGGGAKLVLPDQNKALPSRFVIVLSSNSGPRRNCSIVWQTNNMVGVRFRSSP